MTFFARHNNLIMMIIVLQFMLSTLMPSKKDHSIEEGWAFAEIHA